jgi:glycosyltransferase involved in cell wall biosynthesis
MKVIHVPFCFTPDPIGGTEVYVGNLARDLQALGVKTIVAAPDKLNRNYEVDGLRVRRFATASKITNVAEIYGRGDALAATEFAKILAEEMPDVVHLHAFTAAVSVRLVEVTKHLGIPVIFTYHTPTVSCQRGTLLLWGDSFCDGKLDVGRCACCTLHGLGMHRPLAALLGRLPPVFGRWLGDRGLQGSIWTALRTGDLIAMRHTAFRQLTSRVDHIVAVCKWVYEILLLNEIPAAKVSISRHGIKWMPDLAVVPAQVKGRAASDDIRFAFVGRLDPTKGLHVLINAFRMVPTSKISLDVYGIVQGGANAVYQKEMLALAGGDPRISFREPLVSREVVSRLRAYDFLAVPSQWIETGPMVVLEAFAAGIPVIGWNLGGIAEVVHHGVDGLLIEPASVIQWAEILRRLADEPALRARLKSGVRPPRTSMEVAREMLVQYQSLLGPPKVGQGVRAFEK